MQTKYYRAGYRARLFIFLIGSAIFILRLFFSKNDFAYWLCSLGIVVYICWFILSFFIKTYLDEKGFKEITLGFWKRVAKWEDIDVLVMEEKKFFTVYIYGKGRFLIGYSHIVKDYEELTRELLKICEEKYPHIQIDPEIYKELEKAEGRKAMNQWRIEQVKKFFTRSKD